MHFAAFIEVGEANQDPLKYFENNVSNSILFFNTLIKNGIKHIVFSSTAATYGNPESDHINEDHPQNPLNAYGKGKLMLETILKDIEHATGVSHVILRYFNAAGADPDGQIGESHSPETHLIPLICDAALKKRDSVTILDQIIQQLMGRVLEIMFT